MDFAKALQQKTQAENRLTGLRRAIRDTEADIEKFQGLVDKAKQNLDQSWSQGAKATHRLDDLRKAQQRLNEAINWRQELEGQVNSAQAAVEVIKAKLPGLMRQLLQEKVQKLTSDMEAALDAITEVVRKADRAYLNLAEKHGVIIPPQDRGLLIPMPTKIKDEWMGWLGPVTRGLENLAARRRAGEY
jgi:predicted  nucleic acid-binding Zn-ribbon protein